MQVRGAFMRQSSQFAMIVGFGFRVFMSFPSSLVVPTLPHARRFVNPGREGGAEAFAPAPFAQALTFMPFMTAPASRVVAVYATISPVLRRATA